MPRDHRHDGFLKAILEDVEDDTPRLVYADWLEDRGDPRGEFIRLQCRLDKMLPDDPHLSELLEREQEMAQKHRQEWLEDWPELDGNLLSWGFQSRQDGWGALLRSGFHRGFPLLCLHLHSDTDSWLLNIGMNYLSRWISRLNPASLCVDGSTCGYDSNADRASFRQLQHHIMDEPWFAHVIAVDFNGPGIENILPLVTTSVRTHFRYLDLGFRGEPAPTPGGEAIETLAASPRLAPLRYLNLDWWEATDRGAKALLTSPYLIRLMKLVLCDYGELLDDQESRLSEETVSALRSRFPEVEVIRM